MGLFEEQISRKPDLYPWTSEFIDAMHNSFWTSKEFNFKSDLHDFKVKLSEKERNIIIRSLSVIGQVEISVKKFWSKIGDTLPHPSISDMGFVMANVEVIHGKSYETLLEVLGLQNAFDDILKLPIIKGRVNYLRKHLHKFHSDNRKQFIYSLILFTLFVENIALFSQFYTIMWFGRYKNMLKDVNKQVEYTSREEDLHARAGIRIIKELRREYPDLFDAELKEKILHESEEAVKCEFKIVDWLLEDFDDERLSPTILKEFIKDRMNSSLKEIGYKKLFDTDSEILKKTVWFKEQLIGNNMTDFFHSRPTEYSKKNKSYTVDDLFD